MRSLWASCVVVVLISAACGGDAPTRTQPVGVNEVARGRCTTDSITHSDPYRSREADDGASPAAAARGYFAAQHGEGPAGDPAGPHAADFTFDVVAETDGFAQVKMGGAGGRVAAYFIVQHTDDRWFVISEDDCNYGD